MTLLKFDNTLHNISINLISKIKIDTSVAKSHNNFCVIEFMNDFKISVETKLSNVEDLYNLLKLINNNYDIIDYFEFEEVMKAGKC